MARRSQRTRSSTSPLPLFSTLVLFLFLTVPCFSLHHLNQTHPLLTSRLLLYFIFINLLTIVVFYHDKSQAQSSGWRTSERSLHFCELVGGWPAAFVSQRLFRHKILKVGYQSVFWLIVFVHELVWFDVMLDGALRIWLLKRR
ncbi:unnamed protein product [Calypogeia fissa]